MMKTLVICQTRGGIRVDYATCTGTSQKLKTATRKMYEKKQTLGDESEAARELNEA